MKLNMSMQYPEISLVFVTPHTSANVQRKMTCPKNIHNVTVV